MRVDALNKLKYAFLVFFLLLSRESIAQKNKSTKQKVEEEQGLYLKKSMPLYFDLKKGCDANDLIIKLADSLEKEGFKVIDNAARSSLSSSYFKKLFSSVKPSPSATKDEAVASITEKLTTENIYQELGITNYSCLDSLHNYTITVYIFPKPSMTAKSLNFTLPFNSPARIIDVILSLIERE